MWPEGGREGGVQIFKTSPWIYEKKNLYDVCQVHYLGGCLINLIEENP